jgi:hypothetical protein
VEEGIRFFRHIGTICQSVRCHIPLDILPLSLVSCCIYWNSLNCERCVCKEQCLMWMGNGKGVKNHLKVWRMALRKKHRRLGKCAVWHLETNDRNSVK